MMDKVAVDVLVGMVLGIFLIVSYGLFLSKHVLSSLLMLELGVLTSLLVLSELCFVTWQPLTLIVLAVGVGEAGLGLSAVVKISRSKSMDRVRISSVTQ